MTNLAQGNPCFAGMQAVFIYSPMILTSTRFRSTRPSLPKYLEKLLTSVVGYDILMLVSFSKQLT